LDERVEDEKWRDDGAIDFVAIEDWKFGGISCTKGIGGMCIKVGRRDTTTAANAESYSQMAQ